METEIFDVVILGGGTGGYVAAIRASQLGLKTAVIEADKLGGTCLHRGCIPSKAYLRSAEAAHMASQLHQYGIEVSPPAIHWHKMKNRADAIVQTLYQGVKGLIRKNRIQLFHGYGKLTHTEGTASNRLYILEVDGQIVTARHVILATGSRPATLGLTIDELQIMTSDEALQRNSLPGSVIIIGGGTIGVEWASLYHDLGVDVTVVESQERILSMEDAEISQEAHRLFTKRGVRILTKVNVRLDGIQKTAIGVTIPVLQNNGEEKILEAAAMLLSAGRQPNIENVYSDAFGFELQGKHLKVNGFQETSMEGVYAIGDVCGGGLAHVAALQGVIAAEKISGVAAKPFNMLHVPKCTYTRPEIASIGLTEAAARDAGCEVKIGKFPFRDIGKSLVYGEYEGFAKLVTDQNSGNILGVHLIGPHATDLISESGIVLANGLSVSDWLKGIHAHPTMSEVYHEALLSVERRAIHM